MLVGERRLIIGRKGQLRYSALSVLWMLAGLLFILESLIMYLLPLVTSIEYGAKSLMDALALVAGIFPALYFFVFRPLTQQIAERVRAEENLQKAHAELEQRVLERTSDLEAANAALQIEAAERKLAEEAREALLAEVQQKAAELEAIITSIADGLIICGPKGEITRVNSTAQRLLGLLAEQQSLAEAEGVTLICPECHTDRPREFRDALVSRALSGETVNGALLTVQDADGKRTSVSLSAAPIHGSNGKQSGAVVSLSDVSELQETQRRLQDFVRGVTHDLRTPLTGILGHSQLLVSATTDERRLKNARAITVSAKRLKVLLQDLVDTVMEEAGELRSLRQPVQLNDLLAEVLELIGTAMDASRVRLELPKDLPMVEADPNRLERIIMNLLTNAIKFSAPESEIVVRTEMTRGQVTTAVADRGTGIDPRDLPKVFERFSAVRSSGQAGGLGLGLFVTKMLVEAQGGRIWAESELGKGSTFYFTMPVATE